MRFKFKKILKKQIVIAVMCIFILPVFLSAQQRQSTAAEIETLLQSASITYAQAARFVLEAANAKITSDPEEAFNYAVQRKWLHGKVSSSDPARLDRISLLLMRSFDIKGGIFYSMTKAPHYAYRELVYKSVIQGRHDPSMSVSGERLIFYINRILAQHDRSPAEALAANRRVGINILDD